MNRFWAIDDSKKVAFFWKKSLFSIFFIRLFLHTFFAKKCCFWPLAILFESQITQKPFIFEESYISYGKRQKSCTLIVILVKCFISDVSDF